MSLLDILDELVHLPPDRRPARLDELGLAERERRQIEQWLNHVPQAPGFLSESPHAVRQGMGLLQPRLGSPENPDVGGDKGGDTVVQLESAIASVMPANESVGASIGPYKLLQQIGEGGFGAVFMAEQRSPVRRKVALKVIKLGMDTKQVVARFEAELLAETDGRAAAR